MPVERDRIIGELAVEQGLIGRDEAARYYRMLDAQPGAPVTLAQLLLRDGRAKQEDLERLRDVWRARNGPSTGSSSSFPVPRNGHAPVPAPQAARPVSGRIAAPPPPRPTAPLPAPQPAAPPPAALDANTLKKDELLAKILISRNALTVERAREARNLQIQHRARLGPLLVKQGWCDRAKVEDAIRFIREQVVTCQRCGAPQDRTRLPQGSFKCPRCGGALAPASEDGSSSGAAPALPPAAAFAPQAQGWDNTASGSKPPIGAFSRARPGSEAPTLDSEAATFRGVIAGLGANDDPFASARVLPPAAGPAGWGPPGVSPADPTYESRYGAPRPPPPFGAHGAPPAMRLDTSVDELDPFINKPGSAVRSEASQDELNPFAAQAPSPSAGPGTMWPQAGAAPGGIDGSRFGGRPSEPPSFFNAPPPPAPSGGGFDEPPTMAMQPGAFPPPGMPAAPAASFGSSGPAPLDFASAPSGGGSGPIGLAEEPAAATDAHDSDSPADDDEAEGEEEDAAEDKPADTRMDRSRKGGKSKTKTRNNAPRRDEPREPLPVGKIMAVLAALVFVVGVGGGVAWFLIRSHRIDDNLAKGVAAYDKKDWKTARGYYQAVLNDQADNERALAGRKECDEKLEAILLDEEAARRIKRSRESVDPNAAINSLSEDSKEHPLSEDQRKKLAARVDLLVATARAKRRLADQLKRTGKKIEATKTLEDAAASLEQADQVKNANGQSEPIVLLEKVRLLEQRKAPNLEIAQRLSDLATADPEGWCGHYAKGRKESPPTVTSTVKLEEAILQFNVAIRDAPEKAIPEAFYWRGKTKLRSSAAGRREAKKDFQDAIDANAEDFRPYVELSKLLLDENTGIGDAAPLVQKAAGLAPDEPEVLGLSGELLYLQKRSDEAHKVLSDAIRADPTLVRARRFRAYIAIEKKNANPNNPLPPEFGDDLEQAINAYQDDLRLRDARARERFIRQKWREALPDFDVILSPEARKTGDPAGIADLLRARAFCHIKLRDFGKAVQDCEDAIKLDPNNGISYRFLGTVQLEHGNPLFAIDAFNKASQLLQGEDRNDAIILRAEAKEKARKLQDALDDLNAFLEQNPKSKFVKRATEARNRVDGELQKQKEQPSQPPPEGEKK